MLLSYLGDIILGTFGSNDYLTGPTSDKLKHKNTWARHDVIRGKPVLQEIGQELDERTFGFFFDETFCNHKPVVTIMDCLSCKNADAICYANRLFWRSLCGRGFGQRQFEDDETRRHSCSYGMLDDID